jgi:phosphatidylinositol-3-phosphatase
MKRVAAASVRHPPAKKQVWLWGLVSVVAALAALCGSSGVAHAGSARAQVAAGPPGPITHVVWIWEENHSYSQIIGVPKDAYLNSLAATYGLASNAWAITHPSVPNYLGATSGLPLASLPAVDCTKCKQTGPDLFTQGEGWRAYEESMLTPCQRTATVDGLYQPKHNPPVYYLDVPAAACAANDLPYSALANDLAHHTLPAFAWIAPNMIDDMHTGTNLQGQAWLASQLPALLTSSEFTSGSMVVFIMWDEGSKVGEVFGTDCTVSTSESCHVPLLVLNRNIHGVKWAGKVNHYSVLKATEDLLGLPELGSARTAPDLLTAFGL